MTQDAPKAAHEDQDETGKASVAATPARNQLRVIADTGSELSRTEPVPNDDFGSEPTQSRLWVLSATLDKKYQITSECVCAQL